MSSPALDATLLPQKSCQTMCTPEMYHSGAGCEDSCLTQYNVQNQVVIRSKYRGLSWDKKHQGWRVRIYYAGKQRHVGRFEDDMAAARAYDKAAVYLYGSNAITNFGLDACQKDPTEVSSFIIMAKEQAEHEQVARNHSRHAYPQANLIVPPQGYLQQHQRVQQQTDFTYHVMPGVSADGNVQASPAWLPVAAHGQQAPSHRHVLGHHSTAAPAPSTVHHMLHLQQQQAVLQAKAVGSHGSAGQVAQASTVGQMSGSPVYMQQAQSMQPGDHRSPAVTTGPFTDSHHAAANHMMIMQPQPPQNPVLVSNSHHPAAAHSLNTVQVPTAFIQQQNLAVPEGLQRVAMWSHAPVSTGPVQGAAPMQGSMPMQAPQHHLVPGHPTVVQGPLAASGVADPAFVQDMLHSLSHLTYGPSNPLVLQQQQHQGVMLAAAGSHPGLQVADMANAQAPCDHKPPVASAVHSGSVHTAQQAQGSALLMEASPSYSLTSSTSANTGTSIALPNTWSLI